MSGPPTAPVTDPVRLLAELDAFGLDPATGATTRLAWTPTDLALRAWFTAHAEARHLDVEQDRAGNLWAWWHPPVHTDGQAPRVGDGTPGSRTPASGTSVSGAPVSGAVVTGSHLDSVRQGGRFDGPLGVVSALAAVDELRARGLTPQRPLAVVAFSDEEGARFGVACTGSKLLTGAITPDRVLALRDDDGISYAEALRTAGRDPAELGAEVDRVRRIGAFVEVHVEQGRGLVDLAAAIGVATAIRPHGRWRLTHTGRGDHAGTTRMEDRDDPMLRHARTVLAADTAARRHGSGCGAVATVGRVRVQPGGVNAIPTRVDTWLDARADDEAVVRAIVAEVAEAADTNPVEESFTARVELDRDLRARLGAVLGPVPALATGAGHDAGVLAAAGVPAAMLFVRNPRGVSHHPDEHASDDDCRAGVDALTRVLAELTGAHRADEQRAKGPSEPEVTG